MATERGFAGSSGPMPERAERRVLIVEDNPLNMKLFAAMLAAEGYRVLEAPDGPSGLDLAHRRHPDLIVLDVKLPGMSGLEVAQSLKAAPDTQDIPILATSAFTAPEDIERVRAAGCDGFMAKPIAIAEFLDAIDDLLAAPHPAPPATAA